MEITVGPVQNVCFMLKLQWPRSVWNYSNSRSRSWV